MTAQKMSTRKMLEMMVKKCADQHIYSVKLIDIDDGSVFEAPHPIDLIFTAARANWNRLWTVELLSVKQINNQILIVVNSGIPQTNGDPDFTSCK